MSRLGNFAKDIGGAAQNLVKGAAYVANPMNADDIVKGVSKTAETIAEHPGIIKDVGVGILKEELKPQNLAINAALIAATVATGGAAAPAAIAAKTAMGARAAKIGVTTVRAADKVGDVSRAARYAKKAGEIGRAAEKGLEAGKEGGRIAKTVENVNEVRRQVSPIGQYIHKTRTGLGEKVLEGGQGPLRQAAANVVQGTGSIGKTTRMAGQSDAAYRAQQQTRYVKTARKGFNAAVAAPEVASAVANPQAYAMRKAMESDRLNPKFGDTGEYQTGPGGQALTTGRDANGLNVTNNGVVTPPSWGEQTALRGAQRIQNFGAGVAASNSLGGANAFWKGPTREAFGGITGNYDWRNVEQRDVNQVERRRQAAFGEGVAPAAKPLEQPGVEPPAGTPAKAGVPLKPPTLPPQKMAMSPLYAPGSKGTESVTTPGVRVLPKSGTGPNRGPQESRGSTFYQSGDVTGENASTTITGNTWNSSAKDSFVFPDNSPNVGNSAASVKPIEPLKPLTWPTQNRGVKPKQQLTGV